MGPGVGQLALSTQRYAQHWRDQLLVNGAGGGPARLHDALILHPARHAQHTTLDNGTNNTDNLRWEEI